MPNMLAQPCQFKERITSLDILRGFALLGILVINILLFGMPNASFTNPSIMGDLTSADYFSYYVVHVFGELKFMTLFSILFGAGILLFSNRLNKGGLDASKIHIRRMLWLFSFGMIHAYLIWFGDILVAYSIVGFLAIFLRKIKDDWKIVLCIIFYLIPMGFFFLVGSLFANMPEEMAADALKEFSPSPELIEVEIDLYQHGSWFDIFLKRAQMNMSYQIGSFFMLYLWRTTGMVLLGMVLLNKGVLSAQKSKQFFLALALFGISLGTLFSTEGIHRMLETNWDAIYFLKFAYQFNYFGSLFTSLGYIGLVILIYQLKILRFLTKALEAVGRMAFTNYLCQSIICSIIFYSYGFGMFACFSRIELLALVIPIWTFQMISSYYG